MKAYATAIPIRNGVPLKSAFIKKKHFKNQLLAYAENK